MQHVSENEHNEVTINMQKTGVLRWLYFNSQLYLTYKLLNKEEYFLEVFNYIKIMYGCSIVLRILTLILPF